VKPDTATGSPRNPQRRERLETTSLTAWDLQRTREGRAQDDRVRQMVFKTQERLRSLAEAELGVPKHQRSFLRAGPPGSPGVLLVHGPEQSPAEVVPLARTLHDGGCTVHGILLADYGHGMTDRPEARWRATLQQVRLGYELLRETCQTVHVVGLGFGATLALHLAGREPVTSLVLLAPALVPRVSPGIRILQTLRLLRWGPIHRRLGLLVDALEGMRMAQDMVGKVDVPILGAQCDDDAHVSPQSLRLLQKRARHRQSRFQVFPTGGHDVLAAHGTAGLENDILAFVQEVSS
jgi:esterase/lipase